METVQGGSAVRVYIAHSFHLFDSHQEACHGLKDLIFTDV